MKGKMKYTDYIKNMLIKYSIVIILIIFCLYLASLFIAYHLVVVDTNYQANTELNKVVNRDFQAYEKELAKLAASESIHQAVLKKDKIFKANEALYAFRNERELKGNFALLDRDGDMISTNLYEDNMKKLHSYRLDQSVSKMNKGHSVHRRLDHSIFRNGQESSYYFASPVIDDDRSVQGYLFYFLEDFRGNLSSLSDIIVLTDSFDNVIYTSDASLISSLGKSTLKNHKNKKNVDINGESYFLTHKSLLNEQFNTYNLISISVFQHMVWVGIFSFIGIVLVMAVLIYWILPKIMRQSMQSFQGLLQYINQPGANTEEQTFEEFQMVEKAFLKKMQEIKKLNRDKQIIEDTKANMEIKQLETQFNPHFAFNVLEMLRYEIDFDPENADLIIVSFANLMRYSTYYGETTIDLETDLKYVEDYLKLQKMRFNKRLDYDIYLEKDIKDAEVPKLIIQPLIENSIKHNIGETRHLQINIGIRQVKEEMWLSVTDNGKGIHEHLLAVLVDALASEENPSPHYGLYYCQRTIQLLYGKEYGLDINSKVGIGTTITARMPYNSMKI